MDWEWAGQAEYRINIRVGIGNGLNDCHVDRVACLIKVDVSAVLKFSER
jgi:hypothetical protein